jgi:hypothetical protein
MMRKDDVRKLQELCKRKYSALGVFRPIPGEQENVVRCTARRRIVLGGNRCTEENTIFWKVSDKRTGSGKPIFYPVKAKELEAGDWVMGTEESGNRTNLKPALISRAGRYTESGYRLVTKRGYELKGTHDHPVWACPPTEKGWNGGTLPDFKQGQWIYLRDLKPDWFVRMAFGCFTNWEGEQDDEAYFHGLMEGDGSWDVYKYGVMKLTSHEDELATAWTAGYLEQRGVSSKVYQKAGSRGVSLEWCNKKFKEEFSTWELPHTPEAISSYLRGLFDSDGCFTTENKVVFIQKNEEIVRLVQQYLLMFGIKCSVYRNEPNLKHKRPSPIFRLQISGRAVVRYVKSIGFNEPKKKARAEAFIKENDYGDNRRMWWDRVASVEKAEEMNICSFSTSTETYISNGVVSHNSGKTMIASTIVSAAATDTPITLEDGTQIDMRLPHQKNRPLTIWIIGIDYGHIGRTIHRMLFKEGSFKVIVDKTTGIRRAYREWDPEDKARELEASGAPPLIPASYVQPKSWQWENPRANEFKKVVIINPVTKVVLAEIYAFSSNAEPAAGVPVDIIWIDEQVYNPESISEWKMRLVDKKGWLIWSSWPADGNEALMRLEAEAIESEREGKNITKLYRLASSANKQLDQESLEEVMFGATEEERMARDRGLFVSTNFLMYPLFHQELMSATNDINQDDLSRDLKESLKRDGMAPKDWTHELVLDPGTNHPAILFCCIPPPRYGDYLVALKEFYPGRADALQLAQLIAPWIKRRNFNRFIIDFKAGAQTPPGMHQRIVDNYAEAFKKYGIRCEETGYSFMWGSPHVGARIGQLQATMHPTSRGLPRLRIVTENCPNLCKQIKECRKKCINKIPIDDKHAPGQAVDCLHCLEYFVASDPTYVPPQQNNNYELSVGGRLFEELKKQLPEQKNNQDNSIVFGPLYEKVG